MSESRFQTFRRDWDEFWFAPRDPTLLALIRIGAGLLLVYTMVAYSFDLEAIVGKHGWLDLQSRMQVVRDKIVFRQPLRGEESPLPAPRNMFEKEYLDAYTREFGPPPPAPYPKDKAEADLSFEFARKFKFDFRTNAMPFPTTDEERRYLWRYAEKNRRPPAPPYPRDANEEDRIQAYIEKQGVDPRLLLDRGMPIFSVFFHMTDPTEQFIFHGAVIAVSVLFLLGIGTRITSVLAWFAHINYIHRSPHMLFGADTMMNIVLIYLMVGPSGAALSVDRLLGRWWSKNKLGWVNAWRKWRSQPVLSADEMVPFPFSEKPEPSASANFAIRLIQINVCIIYFAAGASKLLGVSWWNGTAVWSTLANFEFAPMRVGLYNDFLRFMGHNEIVFTTFLFVGTYFTLAFEFSYPYLIWVPFFRRIFLAAALVLHGLIGVLMGLTTFSLIMVVMNMAFLLDREAAGIVRFVTRRK